MARAKLRTPEEERAAYTYLTSAQVADRLGCEPSHVTMLIRTRALRAINIGARTKPEYRIHPDALAEFERERAVA